MHLNPLLGWWWGPTCSFCPSSTCACNSVLEYTCPSSFLQLGTFSSDKVFLVFSFSNSSATSFPTFVSDFGSFLLLSKTRISFVDLMRVLVANPEKSASGEEVISIGSSRSSFLTLGFSASSFFFLLHFFYSCTSFYFLLLPPWHFLLFLYFLPRPLIAGRKNRYYRFF